MPKVIRIKREDVSHRRQERQRSVRETQLYMDSRPRDARTKPGVASFMRQNGRYSNPIV